MEDEKAKMQAILKAIADTVPANPNNIATLSVPPVKPGRLLIIIYRLISTSASVEAWKMEASSSTPNLRAILHHGSKRSTSE